MPLTPQDVVNKKFTERKVGRGYDVHEVDAFLDEVERELARLLGENAELQHRLTTAPPPQAAPAPVEPPAAAPITPGEPQEAALRTLLMAQRTADQAIAEARAEADQLIAAAQARHAQIDTEINARTAKAMADLDKRRAELEARIEDLRAFEREYRLRLKAYLEGQLKDLEGRTPTDDGPGAGVPAAARSAAINPAPAPVAPARPAPSPPVSAAAPALELPQVLPPEWAEMHEGAESSAPASPAGPPRETPPLRAVPPLTTEGAQVGPFTVVPPPGAPTPVEQVDEGPEPPAQS